jgi:hypothetical protein
MQVGLDNHAGWFPIMQAGQPFKLVNHAGWLTMQAGQLSRLVQLQAVPTMQAG